MCDKISSMMFFTVRFNFTINKEVDGEEEGAVKKKNTLPFLINIKQQTVTCYMTRYLNSVVPITAS